MSLHCIVPELLWSSMNITKTVLLQLKQMHATFLGVQCSSISLIAVTGLSKQRISKQNLSHVGVSRCPRSGHDGRSDGSRPAIPLENARRSQVTCSEVVDRSGFWFLFQHHQKAQILKVCYQNVIARCTIFRACGTLNGKPCYYYSNELWPPVSGMLSVFQ